MNDREETLHLFGRRDLTTGERGDAAGQSLELLLQHRGTGLVGMQDASHLLEQPLGLTRQGMRGIEPALHALDVLAV